VVLVEPQLGENIGAVARAMANFGLSRLRLVKPVQGWPNPKAAVMAAGADRVLDAAPCMTAWQSRDRRLRLRRRRDRARARSGQARGGTDETAA
jgi:tRNA C32,U32 (ribose-2'-O)-methylase TrmJ